MNDEARMRRAAVAGDVATVRALLDAGVPVDAPCDRGYTALHHAAYYGHAGVLRLLLERGANTEAVNIYEATSLFNAASRKHADAVRQLLAAGANPDAPAKTGNAPIHAASTNPEIAQILLDAGADKNAVNARNMTPLAFALLEGDAEAARFWAEHDATAHVPTDTKSRGMLLIYLRRDAEKAAIVRAHAPEIAAEMDKLRDRQKASLLRNE